MNNRSITVRPPTPNERAMINELARHAARGNPRVLAIIDNADLYDQLVEQRALEAAAQRQAEAEALAQTPPPPREPSAVEQHGIDSPEAEAKRRMRRQKRLAEKATKEAMLDAEARTPPADNSGNEGGEPPQRSEAQRRESRGQS